jgi:hypothetical protein
MAVVLATLLALYYPTYALEDPTLAPHPVTAREVHEKIGRIVTPLRAEAVKAEDRDRTTIWELVDARMGLERTKNDRGYRKGTVAHGIDHCFRLLKNRGLVTEVRIVDEEAAYRPTLHFFSLVSNRLNHSLYTEISGNCPGMGNVRRLSAWRSGWVRASLMRQGRSSPAFGQYRRCRAGW